MTKEITKDRKELEMWQDVLSGLVNRNCANLSFMLYELTSFIENEKEKSYLLGLSAGREEAIEKIKKEISRWFIKDGSVWDKYEHKIGYNKAIEEVLDKLKQTNETSDTTI